MDRRDSRTETKPNPLESTLARMRRALAVAPMRAPEVLALTGAILALQRETQRR